MEALLDTSAAAAFLGLRKATLETWRWRGQGPKFLKVGGRVRYRLADVDEWLASRQRNSTSDHSEAVKTDAADAQR